MRWLKLITFNIAVINMVITPAFATQNTNSENLRKNTGRYSVAVDEKNKRTLIYDEETSRPAIEIPFSTPEEIKAKSPSKVAAQLSQELSRVKSASGAAWSHAYKNLPAESAMFFVSMGAVVTMELLANYSQNPMALQQHIEHQMSPIGVTSFFAFMYTQGLTSNVLSAYMRNKNFAVLIPYLGMTAGALVQTYMSQLAADPNVKICVKQWIGIKDQVTQDTNNAGACDKAYEYFTAKKAWEFAPGIVSMLVSSGLAAGIEKTAGYVLQLRGIDIAAWLTPGGVQAKGIRFILIKGTQLTLFTAIDAWLNRKFVYGWKNVFDGRSIGKIDAKLSQALSQLQNSQWQSDSKEFENQLKEFQQASAQWRMTNLADVYEAHQNWSEMLKQLLAMYNTSYNFYSAFTNEINSAQGGNSNRPLNMLYPLSGVTAKDVAPEAMNMIFTHPKMFENMQANTVSEAAAYLITKLQIKTAMTDEEKTNLQTLAKLLASSDRLENGKGLQQLVRMLENSRINTTRTHQYYSELLALEKILGKPTPALNIGEGFRNAYLNTPAHKDLIKETAFYRSVGLFKTETVVDYLIMQMICGPDVEKSEKAIGLTSGFASVFIPPQIKKSNADLDQLCNRSVGANSQHIYSINFVQDGTKYAGVVDYLKTNTRDTVTNGKFENWWKDNTEKQMIKAFSIFQAQYKKIIVQLGTDLFKSEKSKLNMGPMENGAIKALQQERNVYLSIIDKVLSADTQISDKSLLQNNNSAEFNNVNVKQMHTQMQNLILALAQVETSNSAVSIKEFKSMTDQLSEKMNAFSKATQETSALNQSQKNILKICIESLQGQVMELATFATIASAVSWSNETSDSEDSMREYNEKVSQKIKEMNSQRSSTVEMKR